MKSSTDKIMTGKAKVLLLLASASSLFLFYLILSSEIVTIKDAEKNERGAAVKDLPEKDGKIDLNLIRDNHRTEMTKFFKDYEELVDEIDAGGGASSVSSDAATTTGGSARADLLNRAGELKSRISGLKAPTAEHKDLHLHLILSISRMETFLRGGNKEEKENGIKLLAQAQKDLELLSSNRY